MRGIQFDSFTRARNNTKYNAWCKKLLLEKILYTVGRFMVKENKGDLATELKIPQARGFNIYLQMNFENSVLFLIRFP
jgi:hypothetical protein